MAQVEITKNRLTSQSECDKIKNFDKIFVLWYDDLIMKGAWCMFETGDKVVYPMHGAGMIHSIEKRMNTDDTLVEYFILEMLLGEMRIMIPVGNVDQVGLRHVISAEELVKVEEILFSRPENVMKNITWNRRFNMYLEKMKTGDVFEVAAVVRTLAAQEDDKKLSTGERRLLNMAKQILLSEVMLVRSQNLEEAEEWLYKFFN